MNKAPTIETVHVEICVVRVDGHKMTLATFRQIPEVEYQHAKDMNFQCLGWVKSPAPWPEGINLPMDASLTNPAGTWILCTSPDGTLKKTVWPSLKTEPPGKQLYMAT